MTQTGTTFPTAAVITASAAVFVWVLARLYESWFRRSQEKKEINNYIVALYAEIDFNTRDMEIFLKSRSAIETAIERCETNQDFIPHITDARHTDIYSKNVTSINKVGSDLIGDIIYFYGLLEKLTNQVAGIYLPSFKIISPKGRGATIREIAETVAECDVVGCRILDRLETKYAGLGLARNPRMENLEKLSKIELAQRKLRLASDLDRINSTHAGSPSAS